MPSCGCCLGATTLFPKQSEWRIPPQSGSFRFQVGRLTPPLSLILSRLPRGSVSFGPDLAEVNWQQFELYLKHETTIPAIKDPSEASARFSCPQEDPGRPHGYRQPPT